MPEPRLFCAHLHAGEVVLDPEESHHAVASLRCRRGDPFGLFDGKGGVAVGRVVQARTRRLIAEVDSVSQRPFELDYRLTLAVAMGRAHRQSYLVEKCTELGVFALWPMLTERSVARPKEAAAQKWTRRCIEAAKQSGRVWVPMVEKPQPLADVLPRAAEFAVMFLADPGPALPAMLAEISLIPAGGTILALIGPEGGWTAIETDSAIRAGARVVSIAPTVLRVETAAVAVCAAVAMISGHNRWDRRADPG